MSEQALTTPAKPDAMSKMLGFRTVSIKELSAEDKKVLLDTVAQGANDSELSFFLNVALAQELNPFTKEVWLIKYGGKMTIQTARDGYLKIARRNPQFDFIQSAEVREGDHFTFDPVTGQVEHRFTTQRGKILGAYAVITRKDGVKIGKYVSWSEYAGTSDVWKKFGTAMICKTAESAVCKQFGNITGIIAEELMRQDGSEIGSPANEETHISLKQDLLAKIAACKTFEEFSELKQAIAGAAGKLFDKEQKEVFAAAKAKRDELDALDMKVQEAVVVEKEEDEPEDEPKQTAMPVTEEDIAQAEREGMKAS
jgi:recombinational DNA repair protein RecT